MITEQNQQQQILESVLSLHKSALADASPNGERAALLRHTMDNRLIASTGYLFSQLEKCDPAADLSFLFRSLNQLQGHIEAGHRVAPSAYGLHWQLTKAMKGLDSDAITTLANIAPEALRYSERLEFTRFLDPVDHPPEIWQLISSTLKEEFNGTYSSSFDAAQPDRESALQMSLNVQESLRFLENHDLATYAELRHLVPEVCLIASPSINAGTSFTVYGFLYITCLRKGHGLLNYIENLAHEAAHHYLFAMLTVDRLFENDDRLYRSPLRTELRPMSGIFHALFVLARTIRILGIARSIPEYAEGVRNMSVGYNQAKNPATFAEKFKDCLFVVNENAVLTDLGRALVDSCIDMVKDYT